MNSDQLNSLIRSILKIAGAALAAHGLTKAASIVNAEDTIGVVLTIVGAVWSHYQHAGTDKTKGTNAIGVIVWLLLPALLFTGCASNHKTTKYADPLKARAVTTPNGTTLYPSGWTCFMNTNGAVIFLPIYSAVLNTNKVPFSLADFVSGGFRTATLYTESPSEYHRGGGVNLLVDSKYNQLDSQYTTGTRWGGNSHLSVGEVDLTVSTNGIQAAGNSGNQLLQGLGSAVGNIISNAKK